MALWAIGCRMLFLLWTVFYDDYLSFSPSLPAASADQAATLIFEQDGYSQKMVQRVEPLQKR